MDDGGYGGSYPLTSDAAVYAEGSGSIRSIEDWDEWAGAWATVEDANLDAGFPLKNGDATKTISISGWFRLSEDQVFNIYAYVVKKDSSFRFGLSNTSGEYRLQVYPTATGSIITTSGAGIAKSKWYHFGLAIDGVAKTYLLRHYDLAADTAQTFSGTIPSELAVGTDSLVVSVGLDGWIDEMAVFDEIKTADDFDDIRSGTFAPPVTVTVQDSYHGHTVEKLWEDVIYQYATGNVSIEVNIVADNSYILHTADNITVQHVLPVTITTEQEDGSHPPLPALEGLSSFFAVIRMDGDLPGVSIESRFAARMEGNLPSLELSAELLPGGMMSLEGRLPSLEFAEGRFGARSDNLQLPSISIESEMITGSVMTLDGKFPAAGIESRFGSVASGTFPAISIEASMTGGGVLTLDGRISVLNLESKFGSRLEGDLPGLTIESGLTRTGGLMSLEGDLSSINFIEGRFGVRANGDLPGISLESVMIAGGLMSLDQNIPPLSIESVFGARTEDMKLPAFSLESSLSAKTMTLDGRLPGVVLSGEFLPGGGFMSLVGNISSLSLEASMTSGGIISLTGKIPTIRMEPSALTWEAIISMTDGILPAILLESSMYATMMELNGVIPTLVSGAHIGTVSTLSKVSRFDNYVLRHVR